MVGGVHRERSEPLGPGVRRGAAAGVRDPQRDVQPQQQCQQLGHGGVAGALLLVPHDHMDRGGVGMRSDFCGARSLGGTGRDDSDMALDVMAHGVATRRRTRGAGYSTAFQPPVTALAAALDPSFQPAGSSVPDNHFLMPPEFGLRRVFKAPEFHWHPPPPFGVDCQFRPNRSNRFATAGMTTQTAFQPPVTAVAAAVDPRPPSLSSAALAPLRVPQVIPSVMQFLYDHNMLVGRNIVFTDEAEFADLDDVCARARVVQAVQQRELNCGC